MTPADAAAETLCIMPVGADAAEAACAVTRQSITLCCVLDHTNDAAILTGQPHSLRERLGTVGPRDLAVPEPNKDLP